MLQTSEGETEILLGNKQLLGIFFVVVVLLGVAFAGGYKLGQGSGKKTAAAATADQAASDATGTGGETHSVPPAGSADATPAPAEQPVPEASRRTVAHAAQAPPSGEDEPPLGSAHRAKAVKAPESEPEPIPPAGGSGFTPEAGQTFLQVAAVGRDEAAAIAVVLRKKGFRAHAVPKPGSSKIYRVLIGPARDAGDLSSTRDSLRKTGFREVIVQRY